MSETTAKRCFTCLTTDSKRLKDGRAIDSDKVTLLDKLRCCVPVLTVDPDTVMELCPACVRQLRASYKFHLTVMRSLETLQAETVTLMITTEAPQDCEMPIEDTVQSEEEAMEGVFLKDEDIVDNDINDEDFCPDGSDPDNSDNNNDSSADEEDEDDPDGETPLEREDNNTAPTSKKKKRSSRQKKQSVDLKVDCDMCGMSFNKNWKLTKHMKRVHNQSRQFECSYCQRVFKQTCHLKEHLTSHTGEKNYSCEICDKKFQRLSSVRRHMKGHDAAPGHKTKRTPFLCTICGKSFPFSNGVQRHMRIHLGIRNHECNVCNRKFTQSTHLQVHMRTHTGEKPYICDTCGEKFSLKSCLMKHIHNYHYRKTAEERELDMESMMLYKISTSDLLSISDDGSIKDDFKAEFKTEFKSEFT